jgi:DNA invertase Pin-like site-specific DNA recombinase
LQFYRSYPDNFQKCDCINLDVFIDDDYTGGNFDRPDWKKLIAEVEAGRVTALLVKDMSRFGRDHVQVGTYMELFRQKNIRFISIGENIDSLIPESLEFAPFINIINEYYLRDTSRKIKASHKIRGMSGKRLTFAPIYGYMLDPNDKNKWIIDPEAAAVVKRIYHLTIQGVGPYTIARILSEEKIKRPSFYMYDRGIVNWKNRDHSDPYVWNGRSVIQMVEKPEYKGHTVNFRYDKKSYKDKTSQKNAKEDWVIFENTHPEIVDSETWETAQRCRNTKRRTDTLGVANPRTGLLFCSDCGAKLYNRRDVGGKAYDQFGREYNKGYQDYYHCSTHNNTGRKFNTQCTAHRILTIVIKEIALEVIKAASKFVKEDEEVFIKQMRETSAVQQEQTLKSHKKRIAKEERRITELNTLIKRLYEDNVSGKLSDKRFEILSEEYEQEQSEWSS